MPPSAKQMNPKLYPALEKRRRTALERPLTQREIAMLMANRVKSQPVYASIDLFYTDEYQQLLKAKMQPIGKEDLNKLLAVKNKDGSDRYRAENFKTSDGKFRTLTEQEARDLLGLEHVVKYRPPTPAEANTLYCDFHSRVVKEGLEKETA